MNSLLRGWSGRVRVRPLAEQLFGFQGQRIGVACVGRFAGIEIAVFQSDQLVRCMTATFLHGLGDS